MNIILINGKKRHGKDHLALMLKKMLEALGKKVEIMAFADPGKQILCESLMLNLDEFNTLKNDKVMLKANGVDVVDFRVLIQNLLGKAIPKVFGDDCWPKQLHAKANQAFNEGADYVLIPDFRYFNEFVEGAKTVNIFNDDIDDGDMDVSENKLNDYEFDFYINNTGKPDITKDVQELLKHII